MLQCVRGIKCKQCQGREEKRTKCTRNNYTATRVLKQKPQGVCAIMVQPSTKRFLVKKSKRKVWNEGFASRKFSKSRFTRGRNLVRKILFYIIIYFFHKELLLVSRLQRHLIRWQNIVLLFARIRAWFLRNLRKRRSNKSKFIQC